MNTSTRRRGILAGATAAIATVALALGGGGAALAASQPVPTSSNVVITKLAQVSPLGNPANGTQIADLSGYTTINGVGFSAFLVPGTASGGGNDIRTNSGQQFAAQQTVATANALVGSNAAAYTGTTSGSGTITWNNVPAGLYVVRETSTPPGVTAAGDFLLAVPLTNPTSKTDWLSTIYVYPKNAQVGATKTVANAADLKVGDTVTWTIAADIPKVANPATTGSTDQFLAPDAFQIVDTLTDSELALAGASSAAIRVTAGSTSLTEGTHYSVTPTTASGNTSYAIVFNSAGRTALATAINASPTAKVTVELDTVVNSATVIDNVANVYPNQKSITDGTPLTTNAAEAKYGSYQIVKDSSDAGVTDLSGAVFRVYATEADARAGNGNYLAPKDNAGVAHDSWNTNPSGNVTISGLRYSAWADGVAQTKFVDNGGTCADYNTGGANCAANPKYQSYWLVEITALPGHQLLAEPVEIVIGDGSATQTSQVIVNQQNGGGFVLPLTGGTGTLWLTIGGLVLLALVLLFVVLRRRREHAAE
ncbi:MAG: SpaH/EbpB family LPXTG-anchored major pilin [Micrococcales bacterium]|nr:SpaH/EbpB family LPXTG-anchored major pilin [Micrococcales bacterium]OJX69498.1 MAG: hypothetical protein BGO94_13380 [Micrococcales bacterium 72-143]